MPSYVDETDLYPPDATRQEATPAARKARNRAAMGTALVVWGTGWVVSRVVHTELDTGTLGLGIGALAGWLQLRRYGWFAAGAILAGIGAGSLASTITGGMLGTALYALSAAGGFAAVYVRYPTRARWALVPAGVIGALGVAAFGLGALGMIPHLVGGVSMPTLLIAGGGLLVFRHRLPRPAVRVGLAIVAIMLILAIARADDRPRNLQSPPRLRSADTTTLPALDGRTLVVRGSSASLHLDLAGSASGRITGQGRRADAIVHQSSEEVTVDLGDARGKGDAEYSLSIPRDAKVDITLASGAIDGALFAREATITTATGDIDVNMPSTESTGPFTLRSGTGDVHVVSSQALAVDVDSGTGDVEVDGSRRDDPFVREGPGPKLLVRTGVGDITVDTPAR